MSKFKIGDKVRLISHSLGSSSFIGKKGTITYNPYQDGYEVQFDGRNGVYQTVRGSDMVHLIVKPIEQRIIEKIHYLDKKFSERNQNGRI